MRLGICFLLLAGTVVSACTNQGPWGYPKNGIPEGGFLSSKQELSQRQQGFPRGHQAFSQRQNAAHLIRPAPLRPQSLTQCIVERNSGRHPPATLTSRLISRASGGAGQALKRVSLGPENLSDYMAGLRAASGENKDAMRALLLAHKSVDLACFDELQAYWSKFFFRISQVQKRKPAGASEAQYMAQKVAHARDSVLKIYDDLEALLKRANLDEISEHLVRGFIPVTIDLLSMEDRQMSSIEKF